MSRKTVCLDFDGVLNTYDGWRGEDELFEPRPGAVEFVHALRERGYTVAIHSTRDPSKVAWWLIAHGFAKHVGIRPLGIRPHEPNIDGPELELFVCARKPPAVAYVDDRAIRFRGDYGEVLRELEDFQPYWATSDQRQTAEEIGHDAQLNAVYTERNRVVAALARAALLLGGRAGLARDPNEPDWPVVLIDLPGYGQVSWHVPKQEAETLFAFLGAYPGTYDGHSTEERYERLAAFARQAPAIRAAGGA